MQLASLRVLIGLCLVVFCANYAFVSYVLKLCYPLS